MTAGKENVDICLIWNRHHDQDHQHYPDHHYHHYDHYLWGLQACLIFCWLWDCLFDMNVFCWLWTDPALVSDKCLGENWFPALRGVSHSMEPIPPTQKQRRISKRRFWPFSGHLSFAKYMFNGVLKQSMIIATFTLFCFFSPKTLPWWFEWWRPTLRPQWREKDTEN